MPSVKLLNLSTLGAGIIITKFELGQNICVWIYTAFCCWYVTSWPNDPVILKVCGTSWVTWLWPVVNMSEIKKKSPA